MEAPADRQKITAAWYDAQDRRPYYSDAALVSALTPDGGEWRCVVITEDDKSRRSVVWNGVEAAHVNPRDTLHDLIARDIAMALTATPQMDKALRCILVLAEDPGNLDLIRRMCAAVLAHVERPGPRFPEPDVEDEDDGPDRNDFEPEDIGERP